MQLARSQMEMLLTFVVGDVRYALRVDAVNRIVRLPEITTLPEAPPVVTGIVNVAGRIIPVISLRRRFRLSDKECALSDRLIIAHTGKRTVALAVDSVAEVVGRTEHQIVRAEMLVPGIRQIEGVIMLDDGLALIHDLHRCLALDEEQKLDAALFRHAGGGK